MDRRSFLSNTGRIGAGSLVASCAPLQALAMDEQTRRLIWYSRHCVDCGDPFDEPESLERTAKHGCFWCRMCADCGSHPKFATYRDNPPADYGPGPGWGIPK